MRGLQSDDFIIKFGQSKQGKYSLSYYDGLTTYKITRLKATHHINIMIFYLNCPNLILFLIKYI